MTFRRLIFAPLFACFALAACGGDDAPSKEEFANSANNICADLEKALESNQPQNVQELVEYTERAENEVDDAIGRLEELEVPSGGDGDKAQEFIDTIKKETDEQLRPGLEAVRNAAQAKDEKALQEAAQKLQQAETPEADRLAQEIGARGCAD
jgi:hypothetical protein